MTKAKTIKLTALLLVVCAALFASGCGAEKSALGAVKEAMLAADDTMPEMKEASSESEDAEKLFGSLSDVSYDKVKDYFLCYAADGTAYEIAVVEMKDSSDVGEMKDSIVRHIQKRKELYKNYAPDQLTQAEGSRVLVKGNRVALVMCAKTDEVIKAFG